MNILQIKTKKFVVQHTLCTHSIYLYSMPILANLRQNRFFVNFRFNQAYCCISSESVVWPTDKVFLHANNARKMMKYFLVNELQRENRECWTSNYSIFFLARLFSLVSVCMSANFKQILQAPAMIYLQNCEHVSNIQGISICSTEIIGRLDFLDILTK